MIAIPNNSEHPKKAAFLAAYAECGVISRACVASGVGRTTHYDWLDQDPQYVAAFQDAHDYAIESMEAEARRRAIEGWDEPVFHEGAVCGHKRKFSDTLLIFMLKGAAPDKYRERSETKITGNLDHTHQVCQLQDALAKAREDEQYVAMERRRALTNGSQSGANGHNGHKGPLDNGPAPRAG